jgi:hypothetical protein
VTNTSPEGWRWIFWIQAIFHGLSSVGLLLFYWPPKSKDYPDMSLGDMLWACDPIGSIFFISGATLTLLSLDWAAGTYAWSDAHVAAPLSVGLVLLAAFCVYGM